MLGRLSCCMGWIVEEGRGYVGNGVCTGIVVAFEDGNNKGKAEGGLLVPVSASRLVWDRARVESKLWWDILATVLGDDGTDMGQMLLQRPLLDSYEVVSVLSGSKYAELDCIRD